MTIESPSSRNPAPRNPTPRDPSAGSPSVRECARRAFSETADPSAYIPRDATEAALSSLEAWAANDEVGSSLGALVGPPGLGKTLLLRLFEARSQRQSLYIPYAGLPPKELIDWIYGLMGRSPSIHSKDDRSTDDSTKVLAPLFSLAATDGPFFLLIDDADSMPAETLRAFVDELPRTYSTLRILMAMNDDARASRILAGFDSLCPCTTRLHSPMSEVETRNYLVGRLSWAGARPVELAHLDSERIRRIFALSAGVPQMVHRIASSFFAGDSGAVPEELDSKQRREDWMGRPFDDDPSEVDF